MLQFKSTVENKFSELVYNGFWFSDLMESLRTFTASTQAEVTGQVRVRLFKGSSTVCGLKSEHSRYRTALSTYSRGDIFDQRASEGFIYIVGLPVAGSALGEFGTSDVQERVVERKIQKAA
jgi:argininosuccinate synthase